MNWEAIGAIGEIVGAIAVVGTLGYLAVQTRYAREASEANTKAIRSAARIESGRYWSEEAMQLAIHSDLARLVTQGLRDASSLEDNDRERYVVWMVQHLIAADVLYLQYKDGLLSYDSWSPHEQMLSGIFSYDSLNKIWEAGVVPTSPSFRTYINELRSKTSTDGWTFHENARIFD